MSKDINFILRTICYLIWRLKSTFCLKSIASVFSDPKVRKLIYLIIDCSRYTDGITLNIFFYTVFTFTSKRVEPDVLQVITRIETSFSVRSSFFLWYHLSSEANRQLGTSSAVVKVWCPRGIPTTSKFQTPNFNFSATI